MPREERVRLEELPRFWPKTLGRSTGEVPEEYPRGTQWPTIARP